VISAIRYNEKVNQVAVDSSRLGHSRHTEECPYWPGPVVTAGDPAELL
jgi:hypothetical protein